MTQLMLDFAPVSVAINASSSPSTPRSVSTIRPPHTAPSTGRPTPVSKSLPLYDANHSELHHIGDLAQAVIDRYDIVRRRRAARLRREALARQQQLQTA